MAWAMWKVRLQGYLVFTKQFTSRATMRSNDKQKVKKLSESHLGQVCTILSHRRAISKFYSSLWCLRSIFDDKIRFLLLFSHLWLVFVSSLVFRSIQDWNWQSVAARSCSSSWSLRIEWCRPEKCCGESPSRYWNRDESCRNNGAGRWQC